ncbi:MAG TPA: hypothetical protein VNF72_03450 [Myxococcota bacterium]|nr:hypothetical protein [Myxococcota bacterium]
MQDLPRRRPASFRPRATLALLYFLVFFFLFCFLLVGPVLWRGFQAVSSDPEQWDAAQQAVQQAMTPRLWIAVVLAAAATVIGGRTGVLPGSREKL